MTIKSTDQEIWKKFTSGNDLAFAQIYQSHAKGLYRYGLKFTSQASVIEDAIHDLFSELAKNRDRLGSTNNIRFYLLKSFKRKLLRYLQRESRFQLHKQETELNFATINSAEDLFIGEETTLTRTAILKRAIGKLTPRQKEAIYLRYNEELDYSEISILLNMSIEAARNLIYRAIKELREELVQSGQKNYILFLLLRKSSLII